jgi:hypothetical protein
LRGHWPRGALVRAFDYYLPVAGVNSAALPRKSADGTIRCRRPLFRGPAAGPPGRSRTGPPGAGLGRSPGVAGPYRGRGRGASRRGPGPGRSPALASGHLAALREAPLTRGHRRRAYLCAGGEGEVFTF